jgi:hypothetical protein
VSTVSAQHDARVEWRWPLAAALGVIAVFLIGWNGLRAATACAWDTSDCAYSAAKDGYYSGTFTVSPVARVTRAVLPVSFGSRKRLAPVELRTDSSARFCIVWGHERGALMTVRTGTTAFGTSSYRSFDLGPWHPAQGHNPTGCQRSGAVIPWDHAEDLSTSWEFALLLGLPLLALALLIVARVAPRRIGNWTFAGSALATATGMLLTISLWP